MAPLALFLARGLLLAALLFGSTPTFAGPKFDLSPYLGVIGQENDFKVFDRSTGGQPSGQRTVTTLELEPWKTTGWKGRFSSVVTGAGEEFDGTVISEDYLIPGKQLLSGSEFYDGGVTFFARKPAKGLKLLVTAEKPQRIKQKALLLLGNSRAGTVERRLTWLIDGFETVETPSGTYADTLRAAAFAGVRLRVDRGNELVQLEDLVIWYASGLGVVRADIHLEFYTNGFLEFEESWSEELRSGRIDGVPFP